MACVSDTMYPSATRLAENSFANSSAVFAELPGTLVQAAMNSAVHGLGSSTRRRSKVMTLTDVMPAMRCTNIDRASAWVLGLLLPAWRQIRIGRLAIVTGVHIMEPSQCAQPVPTDWQPGSPSVGNATANAMTAARAEEPALSRLGVRPDTQRKDEARRP